MSDKASEFIALMTTVKEMLNSSGEQSNSAAGIAEEGAQLFAQGGNATSHSEMEQAAESARKVFQGAAGLVSIADEAIAHAQQAQGNLPAGGSGTSPPAAGLRPPAAVRRLAEQLPVWRKGRKTRALAYLDEDGAEVEFVSGEDLSAAEGLHPRFAARLVTTDHAEGHVAARMRQPGGPRNVTMVINKDPCGGPEGCDATLPAIIPRDSAVTVYVRDAQGVRWWGTYRGTGEGIR